MAVSFKDEKVLDLSNIILGLAAQDSKSENTQVFDVPETKEEYEAQLKQIFGDTDIIKATETSDEKITPIPGG